MGRTPELLQPDSLNEYDNEVDTSDSEVLVPNSVEVTVGDPETDAPRLLELLKQPRTIEHVAGITPDTKEEEIRALYSGQNPPVLLTAESPSGLIVGTISIQKPGHGSRVGEGMRLVVDERYRNLKIARKLVKAANAVMFRQEEADGSGGLGCTKAQVYVIIGVDEDWIAQRVFAREGYIRGQQNVGTTYSWSNKLEKLVMNRSSQPMSLDLAWYKQNRRGEHERFFPAQRLPKVA